MSSESPPDFGVLLNIAFNSFKNALEDDLAAAGFDDIGPSFGYVFRLLSDEACSLSELAQHLRMTSPGALKLVDDMVAKGYVSRTADVTDKRVKRLGLTARGRAALERAHAFHARCEQALVDRLGARRVAATRDVLSALAAAENGARSHRPRPA
jgi:DNA-binding MarR family transcriptional regulator